MTYLPRIKHLNTGSARGPVFLLSLAVVIVMSGCKGPGKKPFKPLSMRRIMELSREDLSEAVSFRSTNGYLLAKFPDSEGTVRRWDLSGMNILYDPPRNLYLSASYLGRSALRIGSNSERFWLGVKPEVDTLWWGRWQRDLPGSRSNMEAPARLTEALGRVNIRDLSGKYLGPVLQRRPPWHVLMYLEVNNRGSWYIGKEIFMRYGERLYVEKIVYYSEPEEVELVMKLGDYRELDKEGEAVYVPGRIELDWTARRAYMKLDLGPVEPEEEFSPRAFVFPDTGPYEKVERLAEMHDSR